VSVHIVVGPGMKLVASVVFHVTGPLFVTISGPAGVTFGAGWPAGPKEIENTSGDVWQLSVRASHQGPIGSEVPVAVVSQSGPVTQIAAFGAGGVEACLTVTVMKSS
jgi:hypothetical protein